MTTEMTMDMLDFHSGANPWRSWKSVGTISLSWKDSVGRDFQWQTIHSHTNPILVMLLGWFLIPFGHPFQRCHGYVLIKWLFYMHGWQETRKQAIISWLWVQCLQLKETGHTKAWPVGSKDGEAGRILWVSPWPFWEEVHYLWIQQENVHWQSLVAVSPGLPMKETNADDEEMAGFFVLDSMSYKSEEKQ